MSENDYTGLALNIAAFVHYSLFWYTPYRTGNLAYSIGDIGVQPGGNIGFQIFNKNSRAEYGAVLNEAPVIKYRLKNPRTGAVHTGQYTNKHYMWVDRAMDAIAVDTALNFNLKQLTK